MKSSSGGVDSVGRARGQELPGIRQAEGPGVLHKPPVRWVASPNYGARPGGPNDIDTIVLHHTAGGTLMGVARYFQDPDSQVSSHYVVGKDGSIVQCVADTDRAWHAGVSEYKGRSNVNDFSLGIEIVNKGDGKDPFTDRQYAALAKLMSWMMKTYGIPLDRVTRHRDVALPPGRRDDPADNFDLPRLKRMIRKRLDASASDSPGPPRSGTPKGSAPVEPPGAEPVQSSPAPAQDLPVRPTPPPQPAPSEGSPRSSGLPPLGWGIRLGGAVVGEIGSSSHLAGGYGGGYLGGYLGGAELGMGRLTSLVSGSFIGAIVTCALSNLLEYSRGQESRQRALTVFATDTIAYTGIGATATAIGGAVGSIFPGLGTIVGLGAGALAGLGLSWIYEGFLRPKPDLVPVSGH